MSRWRRIRTSVDVLSRARPPDPVPPPAEETVALVAALRLLPEAQRRAVVLHHLGDLSVSEVARMEECPENTVKSRLLWGRAALAAHLSVTDPEGEFPGSARKAPTASWRSTPAPPTAAAATWSPRPAP